MPACAVAHALIEADAYAGLDHGTGHFAPLLSTLRLAVVDSEALGVDQRIAKSQQTLNAVSGRKTAAPRSSRLPA